MIGIYKITNLITNSVYIGQSIHIETRWYQHRQESKDIGNNNLLYNAIRKYGIENFSFEIIEKCSFEELDEKEIYWIEHYNSYYRWNNSNGYNMTPGGQEKLFDPTPFIERWNAGMGIGQIAKELNCSPTTVKGYLRGTTDYSPEESNRRGGILAVKKVNQNNGINSLGSILQYSLDGNFIRKWDSCKQIERELKISACSIGKVLSKKRNSAGGYRWIRENEELETDAPTKNYNKIAQYDLEGNLIQIFDSQKEAAASLGKQDASNINHALKGKSSTNNRNTAYGYIWKYYYDQLISDQ